jgi:hypothetical protein
MVWGGFVWGGRPRPPSACTRSQLCSMLALLGVVLHEKHAAPDRQISAVVCASRNFPSTRSSGHHYAPACMLYSQSRAPVSRLAGRRDRTLRPQRQLLHPRLLPRSNHVSIGASAAADGIGLRAESRCSRSRFQCRNSDHRTTGITIHPRPTANPHHPIKISILKVSCGDSRPRLSGRAKPG